MTIVHVARDLFLNQLLRFYPAEAMSPSTLKMKSLNLKSNQKRKEEKIERRMRRHSPLVGRKVLKIRYTMKLFKYYSPKQYNYDVVKNNQLFFSHPYNLNDPFDTSDILFPESFYKSIGRSPTGNYGLDTHALCSFSEGLEADNLHMWAFYAVGYSGFAIEFDDEKFDEIMLDGIRLDKVSYKDGVIDVSESSKDIIERHTQNGFRDITIGSIIKDIRQGVLVDEDVAIDDIFRAAHIIKDNMWREEREWRLQIGRYHGNRFLTKKKGGYLCNLTDGTMKTIILGSNMSEEDINNLLNSNDRRKDGPLPVKLIKPCVDCNNRPSVKIVDVKIQKIKHLFCTKYIVEEI